MIKLSVNETKWSILLARTRALNLFISIWIFDFGPEKLSGLLRNGALNRTVNFRIPVQKKNHYIYLYEIIHPRSTRPRFNVCAHRVQYGKGLFEYLQRCYTKTNKKDNNNNNNNYSWMKLRKIRITTFAYVMNLKRRKRGFKTFTLLPLQHKLNTPNLYNLFSLTKGVKNE